MPKAKKAPRARRAQRAKPEYETLFYRTAELCARYGVSRRTLRRWTAERGYPDGCMNGRDMKYAKAAVHAWERIHMKELHPEPVLTDEDKLWQRRHVAWLAEKAERATHPPPKPKQPGRASRL